MSRPGSGCRGLTAIVRGGCWINDDPENLRCSHRNNNHPGNRNHNIGFRVVLVCESPKASKRRSA
jgi:formylglycine-generating enzyme required for sulfatase activity